MYAQGWDKDSANPNLDEFIKGDIKAYKKSNPKLIVKTLDTIITHDSSRAYVYEFQNESNTAGERVAYVDMPSAICVLVYSSKEKQSYFKQLFLYSIFIKSFHYLSDDPEKAYKIYQDLYGKMK
jgi:hypothetical protein